HHRSLTFLCAGEDPGVVCLIIEAWNLWLLGYPEQARSSADKALSLAQELASPFELALALTLATVLHRWRGDRQLARERAEAAVSLSTEQEFAVWRAFSTGLRGSLLAAEGQQKDGVAQIRQGLAAYWDIEAELYRPYFLALLAEAYGRGGQAEDGLRIL